jgi:hypothetical protein
VPDIPKTNLRGFLIMARQVKGSVTGANLDRKTGKGAVTGSARVKASSTGIKGAAEAVSQTVRNLSDNLNQTGNAINSTVNSVGNVAESLGLKSQGKPTSEIKQHEAFGGLTAPQFDPSQYMATDLFSESSTLPRTKKEVADNIVEANAERKETLRVVRSNLELNTDVANTGVTNEKMTQSFIDYGISKVNTDTKFVQFDESHVKYEIAVTKLDQTREKLTHEGIALEGLRNETDQRRRYWQEKHELGESRIRDIQNARFKLDAKIGAIDVEAETI